MIAVNRAAMENGCLQVLKGPHHIGLITHVSVDSQNTADPYRDSHHSRYQSLEKLDDARAREIGKAQLQAMRS